MPDTSSMGVNASGFYLDHTTDGSGDYKVLLKTENKFTDKDIAITITTPAASAPALAVDDILTGLSMGSASNGVYSPTVTITGNTTISSAGWITGGNHGVADTGVKVGTVNQSTMTNGNVAIASGETIIPTDSNQTVTISEGYNTARTIVIGSAATGSEATITSGTATISAVTHEYNSVGDNFTLTGSADVSAPTISVPGYISSTAGTKNPNAGGATLSATIDKIVLNSTLTGATTARKPTLSKQTISITGVTDAASGNAQNSAPTSGVYVAVRSAANTASITSAPTVNSAGYGTTSNFGVGTAATATVGAAQSDIYYIPITTTTASLSGRTVSYGTGWITEGSTSVPAGVITSGAGTATISTPAYDSTNAIFTQSATGTIAAPTINTAGYVSNTEGTKNSNSISGSKNLNVVQVGVTVSGTPKVTPVLTRTAKPGSDTWVDAANGAATTTKPTSGAYVQIDAAAVTTTLTSTGKVSAEGYGTTEHYLTDTATSTTIGTNAATSAYIPIKVGSVTSGSATISTATYTYNSTSGKFDVAGSANVSVPTYTEGYISSTVGSKNANTNGATLSTTVNKIGIQANLSGTGTKKPAIAKNAATNIDAAGTATTAQPASGYYIAVSSPANTGSVQATATVTSAGYGTTTSGQYTTTPSNSLTVGAAASDTTYIPLTQTTFANAGTAGTTYSDISSTAPVLISGDFLYINEGYTPNVKISLARLIPDPTGESAPAEYILSGYTAFDNDGALIVGTMATYGGEYEVA